MELNTNGITEFHDLIIYAGTDVDEENDVQILDRFMYSIERCDGKGSAIIAIKTGIDTHEQMVRELTEVLKKVN